MYVQNFELDILLTPYIGRDFFNSTNIVSLLTSPEGELAEEEPDEDALAVVIIEATNYGLDLSKMSVCAVLAHLLSPEYF